MALLTNKGEYRWPGEATEKDKYTNYEESLIKLNLESLSERRQELCSKFANNGIKRKQLCDILPENDKQHDMKTRNQEKYKVQFANTKRLKDSSVINMQNILNQEDRQNRKRHLG